MATFAFWMNKQGYNPTTIQASVKTLRAVARFALNGFEAKATMKRTEARVI
jgi:hypothetical protein